MTDHTPTGGRSRESSTMDESLMERRRVIDEVPRDVKIFYELLSFEELMNKELLNSCQQQR